jgi:16S rRNA (guanine527-N7)-methyltransferase
MSASLEAKASSAFADALRRDVTALGLDLNEQQQGALLRHLALIQQWNRVYNLTAIREPSAMYAQHLLDSLAIVRPLRTHWAAASAAAMTLTEEQHAGPRVLDVGSGAGLPGIPIAIACPTWQVCCIDTVGKKAAFMCQVGAELGLRLMQSVHGRVEKLPPEPGYDMVVSRAFASLRDFTSWTQHLLRPRGVWVAMKGKLQANEKRDLPADIDLFHVEPLTIPGEDIERCLVWMRKRDHT